MKYTFDQILVETKKDETFRFIFDNDKDQECFFRQIWWLKELGLLEGPGLSWHLTLEGYWRSYLVENGRETDEIHI